MSQDKDELAKLLGEMAEGEHADDEHAAHADHDDHVAPLTEPAPPPAAPTPPPKATPPVPVAKLPPTPPRPALKPPLPKPAAPVPKAVTPPPAAAATPPRAPVKPALPPRPAAVPQPQAPAPTPKPLFTPPAQSAPLPTPIPEPAPTIISDEEEPERYSGTDDDAVIVPAVAPAQLAKTRPAPPRRQHLSQKLYFKQTIIPILLTLGVVCLIIPALGLLSSQYSPFKALAEIYFMATFWPLGLAFLVFGFLTMFSVKKELESNPPPLSQT